MRREKQTLAALDMGSSGVSPETDSDCTDSVLRPLKESWGVVEVRLRAESAASLLHTMARSSQYANHCA